MMPARPAAFVLLLDALVFAAFAVAFLLAPARMAELVGVRAADAGGVVDIRALYGGFQLGVACFLAWCARTPTMRRAGLVAATSCLTGVALARALGILLDGGGTAVILGILAIEASGALINAATLRGWAPALEPRPVTGAA